jgi:hypothetical protein
LGRTPTYIPTSQRLTNRANDVVMKYFANDSEMFGCEWMFVHQRVHCRENVGWDRGSESAGGMSVESCNRTLLSGKRRTYGKDRVRFLRGCLQNTGRRARCLPTVAAQCVGRDRQPRETWLVGGTESICARHTHRPFVFFCPHSGSSPFHVLLCEKCERRLGRELHLGTRANRSDLLVFEPLKTRRDERKGAPRR